MNEEVKKQTLRRLRRIRKEYEKMNKEAKHEDLSDLSDSDIYSIFTRISSSIVSIAGKNSEYYEQMVSIKEKKDYVGQKVVLLVGVLDALIFDIQNDYLAKISELIHADIFSDFLEMGEHLLGEGYKDAAAVITGSTLENHIKKLAQKNGIQIDYSDSKGKHRAKKTQVLNEDLTKNKIYSMNQQKQITAWLDIRNCAAHGKYNEYNADQVDLMIKGIRLFISLCKV